MKKKPYYVFLGLGVTYFVAYIAIAVCLMTYPGMEKLTRKKKDVTIYNKTNIDGDTLVQVSKVDQFFPSAIDSAGFSDHSLEHFGSVMMIVVVALGVLMASLKYYGRSALAMPFVFSCFVMSWHILLNGLVNIKNSEIKINVRSFTEASYAAVAYLVSFGAVLGKLNVLQMAIMGFFETAIYVGIVYLNDEYIKAADAGGSMLVHLFGAFFGIGISLIHNLKNGRILYRTTEPEQNSYPSDLTALIGTLLLWVLWPNFNALLVPHILMNKTVINTYFGLIAAAASTTLYHLYISDEERFKLVPHLIHNCSLAAGIALGNVANLNLRPWMPITIGIIASASTLLGYLYLQAPLARVLRMHDTQGVLSRHGIPGFLGCICGILMCYYATKEEYGFELTLIYHGMDGDRERGAQAGFQFCCLLLCMFVGFGGGALIGALIILAIPNVIEEEVFKDEAIWLTEKPLE